MWVKLDDQFPDHAKLARCGDHAPLCGWLYVAGLAFCNRQLTDGRIPKPHVHRLVSFHGVRVGKAGASVEAIAAQLVAVGLWEDDGNYYVVHDYLEYQPSKAALEEANRQQRERSRNGGRASAARRRGQPAGQPHGAPDGQPHGQPAGQPHGAPDGQPHGQPAGSPHGQPQGQPESNPVPVPGTETAKSAVSVAGAGAFWDAWVEAAQGAGVDIRVTCSPLEFGILEELARHYAVADFTRAAGKFWASSRRVKSLHVFRLAIAELLAARSAPDDDEQEAILQRPTTWDCPRCGEIHETTRADYLAKRCPKRGAA